MTDDVVILVKEPDVVTVCKPASIPVSRIPFFYIIFHLTLTLWLVIVNVSDGAGSFSSSSVGASMWSIS